MAIFLHGKLARERVHEYVICTEMVMLSVEAFQTWGNECVQSVRREQTCTMDGVIQLNIKKKVLHISSMVLVGNRLVSFVALFAWHMEPALVVTEELLSSIPVFIEDGCYMNVPEKCLDALISYW